MLPGLDVARWQGEPGTWHDGEFAWAAVTLTEVCADGSASSNAEAADDWAWLETAGKGRIACMTCHPAALPKDSAEFFLTALRRIGFTDADGIALDLEDSDGRNPAQVSVWARMVTRILAAELERLPLIRTTAEVAARGAFTGLGAFPLWLARDDYVPEPWQEWTVTQIGNGVATAAFPDLPAFRQMAGKIPAQVPV